ncbi:DUF3310 domain-containing protein [Aggregatibacter kilianii]|uniref:DUF3310 domain-containing protein n=1 Tax=Aggregatibacter kilianii TaxID=2025884 RepID=UPI001ABF3208|nr:DUF3310 domain-containing protein [Aggregatibacter kilianii]
MHTTNILFGVCYTMNSASSADDYIVLEFDMSKLEHNEKVIMVSNLTDDLKSLGISTEYTGRQSSNMYSAKLYKTTPIWPNVEVKNGHIVEKLTPVAVTDIQIGGNHYHSFAVQPFEFIYKNKIPYAEGSVIKSICRWVNKGNIEDLQKARHYIDLIIEQETQASEDTTVPNPLPSAGD